MQLFDFYKQILAVAGLVADEKGFISARLTPAHSQAVFVDNKRLVLPLPDILRNPNNAEQIAFHPLQEIASRGESKVLEAYRGMILRRLNFVTGYMMISLVKLAISVELHPKLTPEQTEFLSLIKGADEDTYHRLVKVTEQMMIGDESRSFVHLYVRRNTKIKNKLYSRVGLAVFPFYEQISTKPARGGGEIYGVELRKADRAVLKALVEYVFPGIEDPTNFYRGSESHQAPSLEALLRTTATLYDRINTQLELFGDHIKDGADYITSGEWEVAIQDLSSMSAQISMIPVQPGNEGAEAQIAPGTAPVVDLTRGAQAASVPQAPAAPTRVSVGQPTAPQTTADRMVPQVAKELTQQPNPNQGTMGLNPAPGGGTLGVTPSNTTPPTLDNPNRGASGMTGTMVQPGQRPQVQSQYPMQYRQQQQVQQPIQHQQQNPYQQQAPALEYTENGLDLNSFFRANPGVAGPAWQQIQQQSGFGYTPQPQQNRGGARSNFFGAGNGRFGGPFGGI